MNGSGTSTDPFIITTPEQFCAMSTGFCYALGCDIDFGSLPYSSVVSGITLGISLDGRGHKVRNVVCNAPNENVTFLSVSSNVEITDIIFENIRLTGLKTAILGGSGTVTLNRCSFSAKSTWITNATVNDCVFNDGVPINATDCNFVIQANWTKQRSLFRVCNFSRCQIRFTMKSITAKTDTDSYAHLLLGCVLDSCTFFADLTVNSDHTVLISNSSKYYGCCFRIVAHGTFELWWLNDTIPIVSAADKTDIPSSVRTIFNQSSNLKFITPEQMKSASYLTSIGIDCVEVDE